MPAHSIMFCLDFRSGLSNLLLDNIRQLISFVSVCVSVYAFDDLPRFPQLSNGTLWRHPARPQLVRPHIPPTLVSLCVTVGELWTSFHCHSTSSQPPTPPPWSQRSPTTPKPHEFIKVKYNIQNENQIIDPQESYLDIIYIPSIPLDKKFVWSSDIK